MMGVWVWVWVCVRASSVVASVSVSVCSRCLEAGRRFVDSLALLASCRALRLMGGAEAAAEDSSALLAYVWCGDEGMGGMCQRVCLLASDVL